MSRLEKARSEKNRGRKRLKAITLFALGILFVMGIATFFYQDTISDWFRQEEAYLIDMERSIAFIDLFELTYVRVYLLERMEASEVTANGEKMVFNLEHDRFELVLGGYEAGDELDIVVISIEDEVALQEEVLIVKEL